MIKKIKFFVLPWFLLHAFIYSMEEKQELFFPQNNSCLEEKELKNKEEELRDIQYLRNMQNILDNDEQILKIKYNQEREREEKKKEEEEWEQRMAQKKQGKDVLRAQARKQIEEFLNQKGDM